MCRLLVTEVCFREGPADAPALGVCKGSEQMQPLRLTDQFKTLFTLTLRMTETAGVDAILMLVDGAADWQRLRSLAGDSEVKIVAAADTAAQLAGAKEAGLDPVCLDMSDSPVHERLTQAVLEAVADDILAPGSCVAALYSGFDSEEIDSLSVINLDEHLNRLTGRDLRQLETRVPLDTLKIVVDLAVEIGREGREGKPVGTLLVVGDSRKVLDCSRPAGFDPVKGYSRRERNLNDPRVREGIKEIAQMDGAIVVSADGTVEAACRYLDCSAADVTLSKGLGRGTGPPPRSAAPRMPWPSRSARATARSASSKTARPCSASSPICGDRWSGRALSTRPPPRRSGKFPPDGKKRTSDPRPVPSGHRRNVGRGRGLG